jgi:hypothetical protein
MESTRIESNEPCCPNCDNRTKRGFTPSQKLRFALWHYWKAKGQVGAFEEFHLDQMHLIVERAYDLVEKEVQLRGGVTETAKQD